jgi:tetratricopeptide (TPR) repeat protein
VSWNYLGRDLRAAGRARDALGPHRAALSAAERLLASDPGSTEHGHDVAITRYYLAEALAAADDLPAAVEQYRQAAASKQRLRVSEPSNTRHPDDLALIGVGLASALIERGQLDAAERALREALPLAEAASARTTSNRRARTALGGAYLAVGRLHARRAEWREAREWLARSRAVLGELQRRGALPAAETPKLDLLAREIARCDSALGS